MRLVVGLGNPGNQYNFTRHNTGFLVLDYYLKVLEIKWSDKPRLGALWARNNEVIFIKPQEFYNNSGQAVCSYMRYYKIVPSDILVICDDFNLEFGKVRYRQSGRAAGNNGLKSIIEGLGTEDFARIRIGTGNDELRQRVGDTDFVLSKFTPDEKALLSEVLALSTKRIDEIIRGVN